MILSEQHKFLFIHIYKNAGTSIRRALRPYTIPKWQAAANVVFKRIGIKRYTSTQLPAHVTSQNVIDAMGIERFNDYFSFAFVRNPWDWEVSRFKYILKKKRHPLNRLVERMEGFDEYLTWRKSLSNRLQQDFLDFEGRQVIDFVGRFENLEQDFATICDRIGIKTRLPVRNATAPQPFQDFYNPVSVEVVRNLYRADIERFGYSFEDEFAAAKIA